MSTVHTATWVRDNFKESIDRAEEALPVRFTRTGVPFHILPEETAVLLLTSSSRVPRPKAVAEDGGWSIFLPGVPVAADAVRFNDAVAGFVDDLREYAAEWLSRAEFRNALNHRDNKLLVYLVDSLSDEQLTAWVVDDDADWSAPESNKNIARV